MASLIFRRTGKKLPLLRSAGWQAEALLMDVFWAIARRMSPERASVFGARLLSGLGPRFSKQKHILTNLSVVLGTQDASRLEAVARQVWASLGAVLAEYPHLEAFARTPERYIRTTVGPLAADILARKVPAIYVTSHLANWELAALATSSQGIPLSVVYGPQSNPALETRLQAQRRFLGCGFISKHNAMRSLVKALRKGESIGLLSDVRVDKGESVEFFGRQAQTATTPAWLSLKLGCPIVPIHIQREGDARYHVAFQDPLTVASESDTVDQSAVLDLTRRLNTVFESWIREQPGQWTCTKRRWSKAACA